MLLHRPLNQEDRDVRSPGKVPDNIKHGLSSAAKSVVAADIAKEGEQLVLKTLVVMFETLQAKKVNNNL